MGSRQRRLALAVVTVAIGLAAPLLIAEVVLRFLPVSTGLGMMEVTDREPIFRYQPNREFVFSKGWDFDLANRGRSNNYGFINDQDYTASASTPLAAVIGDSYVEALMVPYRQTVHGRLQSLVGARGRVYSFGMSGAPLSQYLAYAAYARCEFRPDGFVFVVVGNDFDESLKRFARGVGMFYYDDSGPDLELRLTPYTLEKRSTIRRLVGNVAKHSALGRYIAFNYMAARPSWSDLAFRLRGRREARDLDRYVGNTASAPDSARLAASRRAVDQFLADLPRYTGVEPDRVLFVVDGMRPHMYTSAGRAAAAGSYFDLMREYLMRRAAELGYRFVDMQPVFAASFARDSAHFEWPSDGHWNAIAHGLAAEAVSRSGLVERVFAPDPAREASSGSQRLSYTPPESMTGMPAALACAQPRQ